jgi:aspartyl-tRNA(Asn)/glutamyl-tRNA(Gln) amidotransferase subunit B
MGSSRPKKDPTDGTPYEAVIGLEVHVQLKTRSKMFCACENRFGAEPNSLTCPVCLGHPGSLPVINKTAVEYAVRVGLACGCRVAHHTKFDRKNYFYPDLPKNYQISQYDLPIGGGGHVEIKVGDKTRPVRLTRIHMEEDAGKNIHAEDRPESRVDLNRAGVPLLEIVTEPDISTPEEAGAFLRMLRLTMLYLDVSDCNMEEGSLRCDCNVSIRPRGSDHLETRTEIKNLNSFTNVEDALGYEIRRQIKLKSDGEEVVQQTRLYDPDRTETRPLRGKEEAHDYRYFPEPDLTPMEFEESWIQEMQETLPELPLQRLGRFTEDLGLSDYHADVLVRDPGLARYFEECLGHLKQPKEIANWVLNSVREEMNTRGVEAMEVGISPQRLTDLVKAIDDGQVSRQKARDVFKAMLGNDQAVGEVIRSLGLEQISDDSFLRDAVKTVLDANPSAVDDVKAGKKKSFNFIMGQVMRNTKGQGNPGMISDLIREILGI